MRATGQSVRGLALEHNPQPSFDIPADLLGVNVAPGQTPETNQYILARLQELGIHHVRMDFSYGSLNSAAQHLLDALLENDYSVLLNVFPPQSEAAALSTSDAAQENWQQFLAAVFTQYQQRVDTFEIGNTPNRGRWSGFSARTFITAWGLAMETAKAYELTLAGPNVSDFEPLYNAGFLSMINRLPGNGPSIHTDNLFVERVVEPEAFDHRVLGRMTTNILKLNLIKKARLLRLIGIEANCTKFYCTYTCWTMKRLRRRSAWPEQKQVDYLVRYLALASSSGALDRIYWGPLICARDGLINDHAKDYPTIDHVSFYEKVRGELSELEITAGFHALSHIVTRLQGTTCIYAMHQVDGMSVFIYQPAIGSSFAIVWCRDGMTVPIHSVFSEESLKGATHYSATGRELHPPAVVSEAPLVIEFRTDPRNALLSQQPRPVPNTVHLSSPTHQSIDREGEQWTGAVMLRASSQWQDLAEVHRLDPAELPQLAETRVLRDARNRLWNVADPRTDRQREITVKLNRVTGQKRISYRFRPSKGRRHWNNACNMLRRGVPTPLPLAFYESRSKPGIKDSWYLCQYVPDAFSSRDVYAAFRSGAIDFRGLSKSQWFDLLSAFVCNMHQKQVVHRDLSAGNLLIHELEEGQFEAMAIDIGRAWVWTGPGSRVKDRHRLLDLIRVCYKLDWSDRRDFISCYESNLGRALSPLWPIPFYYYDLKQRLKKTIKGKRKNRSR